MSKRKPDPHGMNSPEVLAAAAQPVGWWKVFHREQVHAEIEIALGEGVSVDDALADTLIAAAQALGMLPLELRMFLLDAPTPAEQRALGVPAKDLTPERLITWARELGVDRSAAFAETRAAAEALAAKVAGGET
jgi:hypothetical protein